MRRGRQRPRWLPADRGRHTPVGVNRRLAASPVVFAPPELVEQDARWGRGPNRPAPPRSGAESKYPPPAWSKSARVRRMLVLEARALLLDAKLYATPQAPRRELVRGAFSVACWAFGRDVP